MPSPRRIRVRTARCARPKATRILSGIRQSVRENDRRKVRLVLAMMSPEDRLVAHDFMELLSWQKVAARRGMSEGTFRRHVLDGFIARFKEAWRKIC